MSKIAPLALIALFLMSFQLLTQKPAFDFLKSLTPAQREKVLLSFNDDSRMLWHYVPTSMFPRQGIPVSELNTNQKSKLDDLLKSFLSQTGFEKTQKIMSLESILLEASGDSIFRGPHNFSVAFY